VGVLDPTGKAAARKENLAYQRPLRVEARRAQGADAWVSLHPHLFIPTEGIPDGEASLFPLSGISGVETIYCNESEEWIHFDADEHGFNNPQGLHRPGAVDVLVVGDSYAEGKCVATEDGLAGGLRQHQLRALSIGSDGSGPLAKLAALTEYGLYLRPKTVAWLYYEENDVLDIVRERGSSVLRSYLDDPRFSQDLRNRRPEIDRRLRTWLQLRQQAYQPPPPVRLREVVKLSSLRELFGLSRPKPRPGPLYERLLAEARRRSEEVGARFLIVYIPSVARFELDDVDSERFAFRSEVLSVMQRAGVEVLDLVPALGATPDPVGHYTRRAGRHFKVSGHRLLTEQLVDRLARAKPR
jgi:hypothetical protein